MKTRTIRAWAVVHKASGDITLDGMSLLKANKQVLSIYPCRVSEEELDPFSVCIPVRIVPFVPKEAS